MGFRERLMYDLVIIGGGPAGVSAALPATIDTWSDLLEVVLFPSRVATGTVI